MGRYRDATESRLPPERRGLARYGRPATADVIAAVEAELGLSLPGPLRELYAEFDGLWFDELGRDTPPDDDTEWWEVLPLSLLGVARGMLTRLYGREARDRLVARYGPAEEEGYEDFEGHLGRCVAFCLPEWGASFLFMTAQGVWNIPPDRVGGWSHDGGEYDAFSSLDEYLAVIGEMRSQGR
jgi:hypothetical protein